MKKLILIMVLILGYVSLFGQNAFKYEIRANGGIRVGGPTNGIITSIEFDGTTMIIYTGTDTADVYIPEANRIQLDSALADLSMDLSDAILDVNTPESTGTVVAGTGLTVSNLNFVMYFNTVAPINISSVPQIADGVDGQRIIIVGSSDTNTLTLEDGNGLQLVGGATCVLGSGDNIILLYIAALDLWIEVSRSNN